MLVVQLIVFLLGAWAPGGVPVRAGDPPQPPPAVARDIEILNRMLRQRQAVSPTQTPAPAPAGQPSRQPKPAVDPGAAHIAELIAGLGDEAREVRKKSLRELVRIGGPAVPGLVTALEDTALRVQIAATDALGRIKDPRGAEPLAALLDDPSHDLWETVYIALTGIGAPAEPAVLEVLGHPDWLARWRAVHVLGEIRGPGATEALVALLNKDRSTGVRVEIGSALGKIKDRAACDALLDALHDW